MAALLCFAASTPAGMLGDGTVTLTVIVFGDWSRFTPPLAVPPSSCTWKVKVVQELRLALAAGVNTKSSGGSRGVNLATSQRGTGVSGNNGAALDPSVARRICSGGRNRKHDERPGASSLALRLHRYCRFHPAKHDRDRKAQEEFNLESCKDWISLSRCQMNVDYLSQRL